MRPGEQRAVRVVALLASLAGLAGCHHQATRAYQPSMAPTYPGSTPAADGRDRVDTGPVLTAQIPQDARLVSTETGLASWYGTVYNRQRSANGEIFDQDAMTAASRTIPLGAVARVTNLATGQVAVVRITDRGPFIPGRILDLAEGAAKATGLYRVGVGRVRVEAYEPREWVEVRPRWCVQIGAFADPDDAKQMKNDLTQRYGTAKVVAFKGPTGSWVRLTLAQPEQDTSQEVAATVRVPDPGVEAYVTRLN